MRRLRLIAVAAATAALLAGCGGSEVSSGGTAGGLPPAGGGGTLAYALPSLPRALDPLTADSLSEQILARQVNEPLIGPLSAPYGGARRSVGLAVALRPSADRTVWSVQLRQGVLFQDGTPFNAAAVLANSRRWSSLPAGRRLLPDLFAVDAPRPNEVRFQLERPVADLSLLLADPRLGIVSPRALAGPRGGGTRVETEATGTGTGPFRLSSLSGGQAEMARNQSWWGTALGLGPAIDEVSFVRATSAARRAALLRSGDVEVAGPLGTAALRALSAEPLLSAVPRAGGGVGTAASVRGLFPSERVPALSGAWLTNLRD